MEAAAFLLAVGIRQFNPEPSARPAARGINLFHATRSRRRTLQGILSRAEIVTTHSDMWPASPQARG